MGSFPWGPHGPETSPNQVKPNPTAAQPVGPFGQAGDGNAFPTAGPGGGGANPFLSFTVSILMVPLVWMFWICLYPLTATAAVFTGMLTGTLLSRVLTAADEVSVAQLGGVAAGFVVAIIVSRVEYKLAQVKVFRWTRHVLRLILFGLLALPWIQAIIFDAKVGGSTTRYIYSVLTHPQFLVSQLANPVNLATVAAVMIGMHLLLWKAERLRAFWHRRLSWLGLK
jgi:hypothetical protein